MTVSPYWSPMLPALKRGGRRTVLMIDAGRALT